MPSVITRHPYLFGLVFWIAFSIIFFVLLLTQTPLPTLLDLLIALNAGTFVLYGSDKIFAVAQVRRVPEKILWLASFAGGPIGALLGMTIFRHKVSKASFKFILALVILVEVAVVVTILQKIS